MKAGVLLALACGSAFGHVACGDKIEPAAGTPCVTVRAECARLYDPPSYANVFTKTLQTSCATGTTNCHTADGRMGGLYFVDAAQTFDLLLGKIDGRPRVLPDNPGCSILAERLKSTDPNFRMPKGQGLSDPELCDLEMWMAAGALK